MIVIHVVRKVQETSKTTLVGCQKLTVKPIAEDTIHFGEQA